MNYIYLGVGDLYLPSVAAAVHLKKIDEYLPPDSAKLFTIECFRHGEKCDEGALHYIDSDEHGNKVFVSCAKGQLDVFVRAVQSLLGVYRIPVKDIKVIPCEPENPQAVGICKALRSLGLWQAESALASKLAYNCFSSLVKKVERPTD